jgi:hypothetical protein
MRKKSTMKLTERFAALDDNLKLDPQERKRARDVHGFIGDILVRAGIAKRTRLQGSLARKTMLPPLHDIDKVIELADSLREQFSGPDGPLMVMELIRAAIVAEIPNVRISSSMGRSGFPEYFDECSSLPAGKRPHPRSIAESGFMPAGGGWAAVDGAELHLWVSKPSVLDCDLRPALCATARWWLSDRSVKADFSRMEDPAVRLKPIGHHRARVLVERVKSGSYPGSGT